MLHQETSTPGRVGHVLRNLGYKLDIRKPRFGDPLPDPRSTHHVAAVVFGGPMSANDPDDFVTDEIRFLGAAMEHGFPVLGICLGAQMMVRALGHRVYSRDDGKVEIGYYPIEPTPAGEALIWWPPVIYEWHKEGFDLPPGAELLASTELYPNQAFAIGENSFALQFHVELTLAMLWKWTTKGAYRFELPAAKQRDEHFADRLVFDDQHVRWLKDFLALWTDKLRVEAQR